MLIDPNIKTVVFDADDTLFCVYPSVAANYRLIFLEFGIDLPESKISTSLVNNWGQLKGEYLNQANDYVTTIQRETEFWLKFAKSVVIDCTNNANIDVSIIDKIVETLYQRFAKASSRQLNANILEVLKHLKANNYQVGVFTNNDGRIIPLLAELKLDHYFDFIEFAGSVGYKKPSVMAFKTLESRYNFKSSEVLHIGNTIELDIDPALKAGWKAVLISEFITCI